MEKLIERIKKLSEAYDKAPEAGITCERMLELNDVTSIFDDVKFDPDAESGEGFASSKCILLSTNDAGDRCRETAQEDMKMYIILNTFVQELKTGLLEDMQCVVEYNEGQE